MTAVLCELEALDNVLTTAKLVAAVTAYEGRCARRRLLAVFVPLAWEARQQVGPALASAGVRFEECDWESHALRYH